MEKAYDLSYDLNGSEDEQAAEFAPVKCVTEAEVTAEQPVRKGYSFVGWNTAKNGSGTSYAAGVTVELSAPVTLFAQWKKDEPAPKPSDNKPAGKPANKTKANEQALPKRVTALPASSLQWVLWRLSALPPALSRLRFASNFNFETRRSNLLQRKGVRTAKGSDPFLHKKLWRGTHDD